MLLDKRPPISYLFNKVKQELLYVSLTTLIVYFLTSRFAHILPEIPLAIPTFLGTAISIILSFKLSQSYDRWWEARKIWGSIVNDSRNLVLQLQAFAGNNHTLIKRIAYRQIAWCYCLGRSLRGLEPLVNLENYFIQDDQKLLDRHSNKALAIIQLNNQDIATLPQSGHLDRYYHVQLSQTISNLVNYMGMAERIKSTIFPVTYRLFLHMIIYVFIVTLSIALRETSGFLEIPILLFVTTFFFLLERTATHLQDPFSNKPTDTAVTTIATTIEINLKQLIGEKEVPQPNQPEGFYLA